MKAWYLAVVLLPACSYLDEPYDYRLRWICRSPEGCERTQDVKLIDRMNVLTYGGLVFTSTKEEEFRERAQRVASEDAPDGCDFVHALSLFGHELEPSPLCESSDGLTLSLVIPNIDIATSSRWQVDIFGL
ncbi:hypothetical protein [Haliangium ochraceum]|uniref:hypothetical protein n=1 Tax=Haliangium ochraceum TaxID=80816 RepID=UPI0005D475F9|nr:hypothetical protein [Haliangium ochraceum]